MTSAAKAADKTPAKAYEPTAQEALVVEAYHTARRSRPPAPRMKVTATKKGATQVMPDHPDMGTAFALLMEATGTDSSDFVITLIDQLANAGAKGREVNELALNFMLDVVKGIRPRDQIEAMLAAQMAATHNAVMTFARRLNHVDNIPQQDSAERAYNKLARTYVAQVEALKRCRSAGEQTVRVEHVTVNEGGQAVVGNVTTGGKGSSQKGEATA